jgi:hypothetical protein
VPLIEKKMRGQSKNKKKKKKAKEKTLDKN